MKSYTDLEQSKKLVEILPLESADMFWLVLGKAPRVHVLTEPLSNYSKWESYPCWSLAALLGVLPRFIEIEERLFFLDLYKDKYLGWIIEYSNNILDIVKFSFDSPQLVDACVAMIEKLHELKML